MNTKRTIIIPVLLILTLSLFAQEAAGPWWESSVVQETVIVGTESIDSDVLKALSETLEGQAYDQTSIDRVIESMYETGLILSVEVFPSPSEEGKSESVLYFEISEALPLTQVIFRGNANLSGDQLQGAYPLQEGQVYSSEVYEETVDVLRDFYSSQGYDTVDITYEIVEDESGTGMTAIYQIREYDWYIQKPIKGFTFSNLINVTTEELEDITYPYIGRPYTQELYKEIETKIQALGYFSLIKSEMKRGGVGNQDLFVNFNLSELPVISSIEVNGNDGIKEKVLVEALSVKLDDFLSITKVNSGSQEISSVYQERGYRSVEVESSYAIDESTNTISLTYTVTEGRQSKIEEILFSGNEAMSDSMLKKLLESKVQSLFFKGNYQEDLISQDRQAIELAYQSAGYIDAKVTDVELQEIPQEDATKRMLSVTFIIDEGELWYFGGLQVQGASVYSQSDFDAIISMNVGDVLNIARVQKDISNIADLYWNEGYVQNTIDIAEARDPETNTIQYTMNITERGQATVEEVVIKGLEKTKEYVLRRELALNKGDIFSKKKYVQSAQNLFNTGLLIDVVPSINYGSDQSTLVVTYTVTEGNQMNIGFGATFGGNVDGFPVSGFLSWEDTNLGGTGRDLTLSTELSPDSQSVNLRFADSWVKDKRWSNSVNLQFKRSDITTGLQLGDNSPTTQFRDSEAYPYPYQSYEQWEADGKPSPDSEYLMPYTSLKFTLGYSSGYTFMFDAGRLSVGGGPAVTLNRALFDETLYTPYDYLIGEYQTGWKLSNRLALSVSWDGRDLVNNTTKGYMVSQNFVYSGGILGGLSNYIKSSTSASGFLKLFDIPSDTPIPVVASLNTTVSFLFNQYYPEFGSYSDNWVSGISASMYEYLYIDGMTLARGITPTFYKEFLWDSSLDVSMQLAQNVLWGEAYVSATSVLSDLNDLGSTPLDWYFSAGLGIRLKVPGFPLGLYLVKNASIENGGDFVWDGGAIFGSADDPTKGLKLVLAITSNLY
ncbi:MAG: outer membrane protein assembly factor BamA [Sphaerochaetaceae bacterium]|nr:outer membrane protein assembly factor BamA [Sphaerochaetaceae bacterium]